MCVGLCIGSGKKMKDEDEHRMKKMDERKKEYIPTTGNRKNIIFFFSIYMYIYMRSCLV